MNRFVFELLLMYGLFLAGRLSAQTPQLTRSVHCTGLFHPIALASIDANTLLIAQSNGQVKRVVSGVVQGGTFLDIADRIREPGYSGIFGMCLHPQFATNGFIYVQYYRATDQAAVIARYTRSTTDSTRAEASTEQIVYVVPYAALGHRSGHIAFGPDGYLYITTGDSAPGGRGDVGDPNGYAQNLQSPFGKLLRIDVNNGVPYAIPPTNPFASPTDGIPDELFATGLRNPWRWSFDRQTGDLWLGDVGQDGWEEVDFTPANAPAPQNYGWRCFEGTHPYVSTGCSLSATYNVPIMEYAGYNNNGHQSVSVTGGYVYRGQAYPDMAGWYVYADWSRGTMWTLKRGTDGTYLNAPQPVTVADPVSFGEGTDGALYVLSFYAGTVFSVKTTLANSRQTGTWTTAATWLETAVPTIGSPVQINAGHEVKVEQPVRAQQVWLRGSLRITSGGTVRF